MDCPNHPERSKAVHPSLTCYRRHGCRCLQCREFNRLSCLRYRQQEAKRREKREAEGGCKNHPSYSCYVDHKCRCVHCKKHNSLRGKEYRKTRKQHKHDNEIPNVIKDPAELERLRRMVGL